MARPQLNREARNRRAFVLAGFMLLGFSTLAAGTVRLQLVRHDRYLLLAEQNRVRLEVVRAPRGRVFDRKGRLLADNSPSFAIVYRPPDGDVRAADSLGEVPLLILGRVLGLPRADLQAVTRRATRTGVTMPYREDVEPGIVSQIEELRADLPHVDVQVTPRRQYPLGGVAAHLLGYAGEINESELATRKEKGYRLGDLIGRSGLERSYEEELRGTDGHQYVVVNALGRRVGMLADVPPVAPRPGRDLRLALDLDVQQALEVAMANVARGAAVAIDPRTGGILAMVSRPSFDPNEFAHGLSRARWQEFMQDLSYPLLNRAIQSAYPPASTYKVITSLAGLQEGKIDPKTRMPVACSGGYRYGGRWYRCWNPRGHGSLDLPGALAQSCDTYYYQLGLRLGVDGMATWAKKIGLGQKTGIDLPQERSGLVPTTEWFNKNRKGRWSSGVILNLAIGQGENLYTPIQMGQIAVAVSMRGRVSTPHVVQEIADPATGDARAVMIPPRQAITLPDETWEALIVAMERTIDAGTGGAARLPGIRVGGKTGTGQNPHGDDHAVFICFAPVEDPQIAIAVLVENGGHGGSTAAPIAHAGLVARLLPAAPLAKAGPGAPAGGPLAAMPGAAVPDTAMGD
ncbi:MAG: penicillin-binding protein 2 [Candidatus Eisenbacteria bacterium]